MPASANSDRRIDLGYFSKIFSATLRRMANEFARHAYLNGALQLTSEQRLIQSLVEPDAPGSMAPGKVTAITKNRLRHMLADLVSMNMDNMNTWLAQLAAEHPKAAIEMVIELAKFTTPQMKAVAVDVRSGDGSVKNYSFSELEKIISEGGEG